MTQTQTHTHTIMSFNVGKRSVGALKTKTSNFCFQMAAKRCVNAKGSPSDKRFRGADGANAEWNSSRQPKPWPSGRLHAAAQPWFQGF